uniref:Gnk2-homologous domain-containing protein n=1 Tax=Quercus lobata TaxID=97700 RepID=A0A7N2LXC4_QUELO
MFLIVTTLMLSNSSCHADVNENTVLQCSKVDYSATEDGFQTSLNNLFSSLVVNGALQNGFYKTTAGKNSDKVYGLIQCRDHSVALMNETDYDDLAVISNGLSFMSGLASTAPKQPLMFQTAVMDVGQSGKRTIIGSKRGWEIYGSSCFMWYHDSSSIPTFQSLQVLEDFLWSWSWHNHCCAITSDTFVAVFSPFYVTSDVVCAICKGQLLPL